MITVPFTPLVRPPREFEFVAFDTEGDGSPGGFVLAAGFDADGPQVFHDPEHLRWWLFRPCNRRKRILAANLEYDWATAFQPFDRHYEILLNDGKWLSAKYREGKRRLWTAWDIQRIAPLSVAQMGKLIHLAKYPTPASLLSDKTTIVEEWYCDLHHRMWCVECYCVRDAEIVYRFANWFQDVLLGLGGEMKMTTASCAMALFRRKYLHDEIAPTTVEHNEEARNGYHGGRVECFKVATAKEINVYDFNSLYASVMRDLRVGLPDTYHHIESPRSAARYLDKFGQFTGSLRVPSSYIPSLPYKPQGRSFFCYGDVAGSWTLSEVRAAVQSGATILSCDSVTYADRTVKLFERYVNDLYFVRMEMQHNHDPSEYVVKMMLNSLYGKFGQRSESGLQELIVPEGDYDLEEFSDCDPVELAGYECFMRDKQLFVQSPHVHVLWAAEIAARARMKLGRLLDQVGHDAFYCDTDSLHTTAKLETSEALGFLKQEERYARITYFAPKEYGGITSAGQFVTHAKGIPARYRSEYLAKGRVEFQQPTHVLESIQRNCRIAEWRKQLRTRRRTTPTRKHADIADYNCDFVDTEAFDAEEVINNEVV